MVIFAAPQHVALGPGQEVDTLDDVEEDLVLPVLDALGSPGHRVGHRGRRLGRGLELVTLLETLTMTFFIPNKSAFYGFLRVLG